MTGTLVSHNSDLDLGYSDLLVGGLFWGACVKYIHREQLVFSRLISWQIVCPSLGRRFVQKRYTAEIVHADPVPVVIFDPSPVPALWVFASAPSSADHKFPSLGPHCCASSLLPPWCFELGLTSNPTAWKPLVPRIPVRNPRTGVLTRTNQPGSRHGSPVRE